MNVIFQKLKSLHNKIDVIDPLPVVFGIWIELAHVTPSVSRVPKMLEKNHSHFSLTEEVQNERHR